MAALSWWVKVEDLSQGLQKFRCGVFGDAHGAVALHIAMSAYRTGACALPADVSAQQQKVDDLLHVGHGIFMLRHAHGPGADDALGVDHEVHGFVNVFSWDAAAFYDVVPGNLS